MLRYKYRWIYAFAAITCILSLGFFYDIEPMLTQLRQQNSLYRELEEQLVVLKRLSHVLAKQKGNLAQKVLNQTLPTEEAEALHELLQLLHMYDLTLQSITMLPQHTPGSLLFHLVITGEFQQVYKLMFALPKQMHTMLILDFAYKANEKLPVFNADIVVYKKKYLSNDTQSCC